MRTGLIRGAMFGILAGLVLCFALAMRASEKVRVTVIFKGPLDHGHILAQPIFTPRLVLEKIKGPANPARGVSAQCKVYQRVLGELNTQTRQVTIQEIVLDCEGTEFAIRGLILDPARD